VLEGFCRDHATSFGLEWGKEKRTEAYVVGITVRQNVEARESRGG